MKTTSTDSDFIFKKSIKVAMNKTSSIFVIALFTFLLFFFFILQIQLSSISTSRNPGTEDLDLNTVLKQNSSPSPPLFQESSEAQLRQIHCDRSHRAYDLCTINGPTVLHPMNSTFYVVDPLPPYTTEKIRPYPRKWETFTMKRIKELTITSRPSGPSCEVQHNFPALVFSAGGYTGNFFHDFNDGLIPLFITVKSIFSHDQEFILVVSKARDWWVSKYADLLQTLTKHPIIYLDNDTSTHCFTSANMGLISHGFMTINPTLLPNSQSFTHFRDFLDKAYIQRENHNLSGKKPRLVLTIRSGGVGRVILNQNELKKVAEKLGFDVTIFEPTSNTPLHRAYGLINSSHALIGVHGAALTHALFLRRGSVFLQVVPLGNEKVGEMCFGNLGRGMGLEYMEYRIGAEESSLIDKYDKNSLLIKDPIAFQGKVWADKIMSIYLKEQNVRIDLVRFREYLKKAYKKAKRLMDKEGYN